MKKLAIISFLILSHIEVFTQINWINSYVYENTTSPRDFIIDDSGNITVGGYYFDSHQKRNTFLLNVDEGTGDSLSFYQCEGTIECDNRADIINLAIGKDNTIYSSGNLVLGDVDYLSKMSPDNNLSFDWVIDDFVFAEIHHINQIFPVSDGIIIAGTFSLFDYVMIKVDLNGKFVWAIKTVVSEIGREPQVSLLPNGNLALLYRDGLNNGVDKLFFITNEGDAFFNRPLEGRVITSAPTYLNEVICVESKQVDFVDRYMLTKYTINGEQIILNDSLVTYQGSITTDSEGYIYTTGRYENGISIYKYSETGDFVSRFNFADDMNVDVFSKMKLSNDESNLILMGRRKDNDQGLTSGVLLVSVDAKSIVSAKEEISDIKFNLYPNPVTEILNITFDDNSRDIKLKYEMHDVFGRLNRKGNLDNNSSPIDVSDISLGTYLFSLIEKNGRRTTRKFLKI